EDFARGKSFQRVHGEYENARPFAQHAEDVRRADVPAADGADVQALRTRDEKARRDRAEQIRGERNENVAGDEHGLDLAGWRRNLKTGCGSFQICSAT